MSTGSPSTTTQDLDDSGVVRASLLESTIYTVVLPIFSICLASFYLAVCIGRYLYWQYRRRRKCTLRLEIGRLRAFWLRAMIEIQEQGQQEQQQQQQKEKEIQRLEKQQQEIKHISPVIPRPATYPNFIYTGICTSDITLITSTTTSYTSRSSSSSSSFPATSLSSSWNNNIHHPGARPHSVIGTPSLRPPTPCSYESQTTLRPSSSTLTLQPTLSGSEIYDEKRSRMDTEQLKYWKRNKRKRRHLLWQWSVAMGYCRYSHANRLTELIARLQEDGKE